MVSFISIQLGSAIYAAVSGLLPTPTATDNKGGRSPKPPVFTYKRDVWHISIRGPLPRGIATFEKDTITYYKRRGS